MDIHFCDLCGVRVTDVDLRGGHGIRKHYDVICATCLELGHGKEWLARHQRSKSATTSSQPAPAPAQTPAKVVSAAVTPDPAIIAHARDRVETFEEEVPSPGIAPRVIVADDTPAHVDLDELNTDDHAMAADSKLEGNQFAAAASSFSALAQPGRASTATADVGDDAQQGEGLKDESTAAPIIADDQVGSHGFSDSPFDFATDPKKELAAQKDETLPVDGAPMMSEKVVEKNADKLVSKKPSTGSAAVKNAAVGKKSNSANSKSTNARSAKGPMGKKNKNKNKNILMMSALSLGILTMILLITIKVLQSSRKQQPQQTIVFDMSQDLRDAIKEAKSAATAAFNSKNVAQMNAAKIKIQEVRPKIYNFEKEVKAKHADKWNEDDYGRYLEVVDWPNTNLMHKMLSDEILKQRDY